MSRRQFSHRTVPATALWPPPAPFWADKYTIGEELPELEYYEHIVRANHYKHKKQLYPGVDLPKLPPGPEVSGWTPKTNRRVRAQKWLYRWRRSMAPPQLPFRDYGNAKAFARGWICGILPPLSEDTPDNRRTHAVRFLVNSGLGWFASAMWTIPVVTWHRTAEHATDFYDMLQLGMAVRVWGGLCCIPDPDACRKWARFAADMMLWATVIELHGSRRRDWEALQRMHIMPMPEAPMDRRDLPF